MPITFRTMTTARSSRRYPRRQRSLPSGLAGNEMRLSEAIGRLGLVVVAKPSQTNPGVRSSHANPESYDNGCGMGPEFAGNALALAMLFSREDRLRR